MQKHRAVTQCNLLCFFFSPSFCLHVARKNKIPPLKIQHGAVSKVLTLQPPEKKKFRCRVRTSSFRFACHIFNVVHFHGLLAIFPPQSSTNSGFAVQQSPKSGSNIQSDDIYPYHSGAVEGDRKWQHNEYESATRLFSLGNLSPGCMQMCCSSLKARAIVYGGVMD